MFFLLLGVKLVLLLLVFLIQLVVAGVRRGKALMRRKVIGVNSRVACGRCAGVASGGRVVMPLGSGRGAPPLNSPGLAVAAIGGLP